MDVNIEGRQQLIIDEVERSGIIQTEKCPTSSCEFVFRLHLSKQEQALNSLSGS